MVDMADTTVIADIDSDSSGANSNGSKTIHWTKKTGARKLQIVKL
jgi:hypothetical protein